MIVAHSRQLLRDLIAIPSINNAFLPPDDSRAGEQGVADFLAATAAAAGLAVEFQPVFPGRSNILARLLPPQKTQSTILLAPHMDTVGEPGHSPALFNPRIKNGRMHGRGACDTKGSVAAMLSAILAVARSGKRPQSTEIIFAGLVDEENAQTGSRVLGQSGLRADLAIVGEPTQLKIVTAHKGDLWLRLETHGKAAHGARPELGRNAVHLMAKVVDALEIHYAAALKKRRHPLLGNPTINVGSINGGSQPNIVPDHCEISADRRTLPGETESSVRREINALLRARRLSARLSNAKTAPCAPLETNPQLPWIQSLLRIARQKQPCGVDFFCDAAILAQAGIPSVVFGPGNIAQAHTADEWISLESLDRATALLTEFLRSLP